MVPANGTVQDIMTEAARHLNPAWGITAPLRVLETVEGTLSKQYGPEVATNTLTCFHRPNIFYHCLRVESDAETANGDDADVLLEIYHCDRASQQAFAQPLLLPVSRGEKSGSIKKRCKDKLQVPDTEFKSWRLVRMIRTTRTHLKDDEAWDSEIITDAKFYLEHVHPNPTSNLARQSRYNKPLTIKAG